MIRRLRRLLPHLAALVLLAALAWVVWGIPWWQGLKAEVAEAADAHVDFQVAHPGWSYPVRVWSAPAPLDLPPERLAAHARIRGYAEACPPVAPGSFCPNTGAVIPRGGRFPEGVQPPGVEGWTRPLALEPIRIGLLVGPDGELREHLPVDEAPAHLLAAIVAAEDQGFHEHAGVKFSSLVRAAWANARGVGVLQGGSTLTMQAMRIVIPRRRGRTLQRKVWETAAALALDAHLGKQGVLQVYLDGPYLGQAGNLSVSGFQAAAWHYWGIDARDLSLSQAAILASILPAPGRFNPITSPEEARTRRDRTLRRMEAAGWDVTDALAEPVSAIAHPWPADRYPSYLQETRRWLEENLDAATLYGGGLEVFTGLDVVAQEAGAAEIEARLPEMVAALGRRQEQPLRAAVALVDPVTGALAAVHDSGMSAATDFSRATQARRQVGSAFKPLVYALAFDRSYPLTGDAPSPPPFTAATPLPNQWRDFSMAPGWHPRNVGGFYSPTSSLAYALAWSQNIATAALLEQLGGPEPLIALAGRFGLPTDHLPHEMGLALGQAELSPLDMARVVATVSNGGLRVSGAPVLEVRDARGAVRHRLQPPSERVLSPEAAELTRALMQLVIDWGTGGAARGAAGRLGVRGPAIGKTGTTDQERDLWFVGATPHHAGALWIGFDTPASIGASASDLASPLWGWWMRAVEAGLAEGTFDGPKARVLRMCAYTGCRDEGQCVTMPAPFLEGTGPYRQCPDVEVQEKEHHERLWDKVKAAQEEAAAQEGEAAPQDDGATRSPASTR
ncbi:MAG: transglycosylase domain-containing protein [Alphaproteobacteria bacterium]|nr:transglycosylase domain-containing protein [Alphaproteobacteria bacterium]